MFFNRRHLIENATISIIVVSQKYTMIPARIRSTASWLILFKLNPFDFETVYKDSVLLDKKRWNAVVGSVYGTNSEG